MRDHAIQGVDVVPSYQAKEQWSLGMTRLRPPLLENERASKLYFIGGKEDVGDPNILFCSWNESTKSCRWLFLQGRSSWTMVEIYASEQKRKTENMSTHSSFLNKTVEMVLSMAWILNHKVGKSSQACKNLVLLIANVGGGP